MYVKARCNIYHLDEKSRGLPPRFLDGCSYELIKLTSENMGVLRDKRGNLVETFLFEFKLPRSKEFKIHKHLSLIGKISIKEAVDLYQVNSKYSGEFYQIIRRLRQRKAVIDREVITLPNGNKTSEYILISDCVIG